MFPLWPKVLYSAFVAVLVPVYWRHYGPANFLWFSDIALFVGLAAFWWEDPLLASMAAVSVTLLELCWLFEYVFRLLTGKALVGLASYMFRSDLPLYLRALSLFHVGLPVFLPWLVWRLGYDPRAWVAQTLLAWVVLLACYFLTPPEANINWVFGLGERPRQSTPSGPYLLLLMLGFPLCLYLPTHLLFKALFPIATVDRAWHLP